MLEIGPAIQPHLVHVLDLGLQADIGTASPPFNPIRLLLLIGYVYLCMYCVQRAQFGALVPKAYKPLANVVTLVAGPFFLLLLVIIETAKKSRRRQEPFFPMLFERIRDAVSAVGSITFKRRQDDSTVHLMDSAGRTLDEIYGRGQGKRDEAHSLELTEATIAKALDQRASDILIDPQSESTYTIRLRVDGVLRLAKELDSQSARSIINSIKAVSGMDISERRRTQDGAFTARRGQEMASFRVASAGAMNGEKLSIRVLNGGAANCTLTDLGLDHKYIKVIENAMNQPSGLILICGPTGSGKTTTMYGMLGAIDRFERNVITVEDPIEAVLPEVSQIEVNTKADITFASTLRGVLRQDPDVICVGEIRDEETAEMALRAAQTGHLVLATIHCNGNAEAIVRLLDLGVSPLLLSSGLSLVMSQRLLRCLCENCKEPAELSKSQLARLRMKKVDPQNIRHAGQCKRCNQTGYFDRTAICDVMVVDKKLKAEIATNTSFLSHLRAEGAKNGQSNLRKQGMKKVLRGVTSFQELKRVVG